VAYEHILIFVNP